MTSEKRLKEKLSCFLPWLFFGIAIWFLWDMLILGDPLYFTHSQFSANAQQQSWLSRGELPAYHNFIQAILYYTVTVETNLGLIVALLALIAFIFFLLRNRLLSNYILLILLFVPFIFNVVTLFLGQSVIFIPLLTPKTFQWQLFNARYGVLMVPAAAVLIGFLFANAKLAVRTLFLLLIVSQLAVFQLGYQPVITYQDGVSGLSASKKPDAQHWLASHYTNGLVLLDDYARTISIIESGIPMHDVVYIGNKPYWDNSLREPQKNVTWVVMQKDDTVWKALYTNKDARGMLYKYYKKVYTSPDILIFERNKQVALSS